MSALYPILIRAGTQESLCILLCALPAWGSQSSAESGESPESQPGCNEGGTGREVIGGMGEAQGPAGAKRRCLIQLGYVGGGVRQSFLEAKGREQYFRLSKLPV